MNAGQFLKLNKFKVQIEHILLHGKLHVTGKSVFLLFEEEDEALKGQEELVKLNNYEDKPYKTTLIPNFVVQQKKKNEQIQLQQIETEQAPQAKTLLEVTQPLLLIDNELFLKQKSVRNALQHQFERLLHGQTLQSQFDLIKTHRLTKQMPKYLAKQNLRDNVLHIPQITQGKVVIKYRTKGEFKIVKENQIVVGSFYRVRDSEFHVFNAKEMEESQLFPFQVIQYLTTIEKVLQTQIEKIQKLDGYVTIKCAGEVKDDTFEANEFLATFTDCQFDTDIQALLTQSLQGIKCQFETFEKYITQTINGLKFNISHHSFFQQNIEVFGLILEYISRKCSLKTTIYDVCCGSGIIGQTLAQELLKQNQNAQIKVLGVEIVPEAIQEARKTFEQNFAKFQNVQAQYFCEPVEQHKFQCDEQTFMVLDPPRSGVPQKVLKLLRETQIQQIFYISCNYKQLAVDLYTMCCVDLKEHTVPFYVDDIMLFDMFPGCDHVETVVKLNRCVDWEGNVEQKENEEVKEVKEQ